MEWVQIYDPLGSALLSTAAAALPIVLLLVTLAFLERPAYQSALAGLAANPICSKPWADPIAALALIPVILREGWEAVHSSILGCQCSPNSV